MKGQALVESAIIFPILVLFFLGVLEVGWALRSYLALANANREAARYAARPGYLDMNDPSNVYEHMLISLSEQVPFDGGMVITYAEYDVLCAGVYTVTSPVNVPTYTWAYPATYTTRLDYNELDAIMVAQQRSHSCAKEAAALPPHKLKNVTVEMYYDHPHLFGLSPIGNPVPMYMHSTFRVLDRRN